MALVYSPHTTCAIVINEHESGFIEDFNELLAELAPEDGRYYRHDDLEIRTEGIEDDTGMYPNGHSHLRAGILSSSSQTVPIVDGNLMLGRWQRIFFCELDWSRPRKIFIQVIGEGPQRSAGRPEPKLGCRTSLRSCPSRRARTSASRRCSSGATHATT